MVKKTIYKKDLHCYLTQAAVIMSGEKFLRIFMDASYHTRSTTGIDTGMPL